MQLNTIELRVLGALLEKCLATPNAYPLTLNSLTLACNQSTSREPVTDYSDALVEETLTELREKRLVVQHLGARAAKFSQTLSLMADISQQQLALLAVLMLRGAQTPGDLRQRTERMADFADLAAVQAALDGLATRQPPLVAPLAKRAGEKELRYTQLFNSDAATAAIAPGQADAAPLKTPTQVRLDALEAELAALRAEFALFRKQFD
jgi:uncharacterized protein